jgi:carbamoyl-phosphate synthase large subunit
VAQLIRGGKVDLVINTPFGRGARTDGYYIRTAAAAAGVPCITTIPGLYAALRGIDSLRSTAAEPRTLQEHHAHARATAARQQLRLEIGTGSPSAQPPAQRAPEPTPASKGPSA